MRLLALKLVGLGLMLTFKHVAQLGYPTCSTYMLGFILVCGPNQCTWTHFKAYVYAIYGLNSIVNHKPNRGHFLIYISDHTLNVC